MSVGPNKNNPENLLSEEKYDELFTKLTRYFSWNGCRDTEDLAQNTIIRGLLRIQDGAEITTADPASFFFGIARNVVREQRRTRTTDQLSDADARPSRDTAAGLSPTEMAILLKQCLAKLPPADRSLLETYASGVTEHEFLSPELLRTRVHRIRARLIKLCGLQKKKIRP